MANDNVITVIGNLAAEPELRYTQSGVAVTNVRVAVNRRVRNPQTNDWEDRLDGFFNANIWREQAENVAESLHTGDRVLIQGYLRSRSYTDRDGQEKWVTEIEADEICPSLKWARVSIEKVSGGGWGRRPSPGGSAPAPSEPPTPDGVPF